MIYACTAYGLTLHLCFPCPLLPEIDPTAPPDVVVTESTVPISLDPPYVSEYKWQATAERYLWLGGPRSGRFLVEGGRCVTLQRAGAAEDERLAEQFIGFVLVAILRQRGLLVLHAGAVATRSGAWLISGVSGAGKSTTVSALLARGCALLADDVSVLTRMPDGRIHVLPGMPQVALCPDAVTRLEHQKIGRVRRSPTRTKSIIRPQTAVPTKPVPLRAITLLRASDCDDVKVRTLHGGERFLALQECIYGPLLPEEHAGRFELIAAVAEQVSLSVIERPIGRWTVDEVVEAILHD